MSSVRERAQWASTFPTTYSSLTFVGMRECGRWEFLFSGAPLRIAAGNGSPINPIAIL